MNAITVIDIDKIYLDIRKGEYRYIGSGSGRRVYDLDNGYVAKLAKNRKGLAQNKAEYQISITDDSNLFAKIPKVSDEFGILIMEKAERIKGFEEVLNYFHVKNNRELFQLSEMNYILSKHNLLAADLRRSANWGVVHNRIVIIDYGYTQRVKNKYYSFLNF